MSSGSPKFFHILNSPLFSVVLLTAIVFFGSGFLRPLEVEKKLPGEAVEIIPPQKIERGEKHDAYPTIPPTSGWHIESNQRDGVFTATISDEEIVAALLRGAVVMAYNCSYKAEKINPLETAPPPSGTVDSSAPDLLSDSEEEDSSANEKNKNDPDLNQPKQSKEEMMRIYSQIQQQNVQCGNILVPLRKLVEEEGTDKLLLVPYAKMDTRIALLAWGRMDKMLWFDEERTKEFIRTFRREIPIPEE